MHFDTVPYTDMDFSKLHYKSSTVKDLKKRGIDIHHPETVTPNGFFIIPGRPGMSPSPTSTPPPAYSSLGYPELNKRFAKTTIHEVTSDRLNQPQAQHIPRKSSPVPPPNPKFPRVRATADFLTDDIGELNVRSGMTLDILKDLGDGWLTAQRLDGTVGIVPKSFTVPM